MPAHRLLLRGYSLTKTVLGLLRHGQTDWNIDFRLQGVTDIPLNETGIAQAQDAAVAINQADWDVVLTSPLSRAVDTAQIVVRENNFPALIVEELLLERSFGEAEGLSHDEWRARYADTNTVPGGESLHELQLRSEKLLAHLAEKYAGNRVLAVTHGALIRKLLRIVSNNEFPRDGERLGNACLSIFVHEDGAWRVEKYDPRTLHSDLH
jgi:broad specificity phosphatase PhoE